MTRPLTTLLVAVALVAALGCSADPGSDDGASGVGGAGSDGAGLDGTGLDGTGLDGTGLDAAGPTRPTGVLLVVVDTLRADRLHCYGYPYALTPNIDALADAGTLYERNLPQGSWTLPSMFSFMSGMYLERDGQTRFAQDQPVLAELLSEAGVATGAFVANPVLDAQRGFDRGFDRFELMKVGAARGAEGLDVAGAAAEWITDAVERGDRWFAWVHLMDPHTPYDVTTPRGVERTTEGERPDLEQLLPRWAAAQARARTYRAEHGADPSTMADAEQVLGWMKRGSNHYDGEVADADAAVGALLARLEDLGVDGSTLVVLAADHGEMLWEYDIQPGDVERIAARPREPSLGAYYGGAYEALTYGHHPWFYPQHWRTPLILRGPGVATGARIATPSANLDVHATVLDALDVAAVGPTDSRSMWNGARPERDRVYAIGRGTTAAIDRLDRVVIEYAGAQFPTPPGRPKHLSVFDWSAGDWLDLVGATPDESTADALRAELESWRGTVRFETVTTPIEGGEEVLRALGYVEEADAAAAAETAGN